MIFTIRRVCSLLLIAFLGRVELITPVFTVTEGGEVTLPCNYTRNDPPLPQHATVIWKDPMWKTLSSSKYPFNLLLSNVTKNQSGIYQCHIYEVRSQQNVYLNVTGQVSRIEDTAGAKGGAAGFHFPVCSVAALFHLVLFH